jgi:hypothetical protein
MTTAFRSHTLRCFRSPVALSAEVTTQAGRPEAIVNLSGSGCLLQTRDRFVEGQTVRMRFSLPGAKEIEAEGRVARITNENNDVFVGVAFENLGERDSEFIARHVMAEQMRRRAV